MAAMLSSGVNDVLQQVNRSHADSVDESVLQTLKEKLVELDEKALMGYLEKIAGVPRVAPKDLIVEGKRKREAGEWSKDVARCFGMALKSAKYAEQCRERFVEALHPKWKRWRFALVRGLVASHEESFALQLQFFDSSEVLAVPLSSVINVAFVVVSLLTAAADRNIQRIVEVMEMNLDVSECVRTGCTLAISLTVGDTSYRNEFGQRTRIVELMLDILANYDDADLAEQAARVLMNLACELVNVHKMVSLGVIHTFVNVMKKYPSDQGVQYAIIKSLHNISIDNDEYRDTMEGLGVIAMIENVKETYFDNGQLCIWATRCIQAITMRDSSFTES